MITNLVCTVVVAVVTNVYTIGDEEESDWWGGRIVIVPEGPEERVAVREIVERTELRFEWMGKLRTVAEEKVFLRERTRERKVWRPVD